MGNKKSNVIVAVVLIVIGVCGILNQGFGIRIIGHVSFWDLGVLALGLFFEWQYFSTRRSPGILVPGGILTVVGLFNFLESLWGGVIYADFPSGEIGVALGLFQLYWFGKRNKWLLIPVVILVVSAMDELANGLFGWFNSSLVWPICLVVLGICLIFSQTQKTDGNEKDSFQK